jgi:hypothetical protein
MTETQTWGSGYRTGVKIARAVRLHGGRRRAGRSRQEIIPAGAHIETFAEAVRWGAPFLDWGKMWRWLAGGAR